MIEWLSKHVNEVEILVLLISAVSAYLIYHINKLDKIKSAAIAVKQQIKDIEKHIDILKRYCVDSYVINELDLYISTPVINQNQFDRYLEELIPHLSQDEYEMLYSFYELANTIQRLQNEVKQFSLYALQSRANNYYAQSYGLWQKLLSDHVERSNLEGNGDNNAQNTEMNVGINISDSDRVVIQNMVLRFCDEFNKNNVGPYIPVQYKIYFDKYLREYSKLSGTTLLSKIEVLANKKRFFII